MAWFAQPRWLRRFIRRHTSPMTVEEALGWKKKLAFLYMVTGWNLVGVVVYMCFTGRQDWPTYYGLKSEEEVELEKNKGLYFARLLDVKQATIVNYRGFSKVGEIEYVKEETETPEPPPQ